MSLLVRVLVSGVVICAWVLMMRTAFRLSRRTWTVLYLLCRRRLIPAIRSRLYGHDHRKPPQPHGDDGDIGAREEGKRDDDDEEEGLPDVWLMGEHEKKE